MSVKFDQREDIRVTTNTAAPRGPPAPSPLLAQSQRKEGFAHEIGDALTKGAGPNGYLAVSCTPMRAVLASCQTRR